MGCSMGSLSGGLGVCVCGGGGVAEYIGAELLPHINPFTAMVPLENDQQKCET